MVYKPLGLTASLGFFNSFLWGLHMHMKSNFLPTVNPLTEPKKIEEKVFFLPHTNSWPL